jgi:hypothetical protein
MVSLGCMWFILFVFLFYDSTASTKLLNYIYVYITSAHTELGLDSRTKYTDGGRGMTSGKYHTALACVVSLKTRPNFQHGTLVPSGTVESEFL